MREVIITAIVSLPADGDNQQLFGAAEEALHGTLAALPGCSLESLALRPLEPALGIIPGMLVYREGDDKLIYRVSTTCPSRTSATLTDLEGRPEGSCQFHLLRPVPQRILAERLAGLADLLRVYSYAVSLRNNEG